MRWPPRWWRSTSLSPATNPLTWTCHVCGDERPDEWISVFTDSEPIAGTDAEMTVNVRFCNDRRDCIRGAPVKAREWLA